MVNQISLSTHANHKKKSDIPIFLGLSVVIIFFVISGFISYWNIHTLKRDNDLVVHTHEVIIALEDLLSVVKDAETGQRGYLLTGDEKYLEPYNGALAMVNVRFTDTQRLLANNPEQSSHLLMAKSYIDSKLSELTETVALRRTQGFDAARAVVVTDRGKNAMDALRNQIGIMEKNEKAIRARRLDEMAAASRTAILSSLLTGILGVLLSGLVSYWVRRATLTRERQEWLQSGQVGLSAAMFGEQRPEQLADNILKFLAEYLDAHAAAFFVKDGENYRRLGTYGLPQPNAAPQNFTLRDGLLGQAAKDQRTFLVRDVPDGYLMVGSALGHGKPKRLIVSPATVDGNVIAVLELGFIHSLNALTIEFLERVQGAIGIAVRSANDRQNLQNLLEETQRQGEELQAQSEELRVSNEELEEQSRALKESQFRLEQQQAELEQTNSQLEEQTQLLENQRDDLERTKAAVQTKAQELAQASQYKSDFLANMSHELRTPLNSSLILAKLLADNPAGNLTAEQVKFAETIQSSGNDLLSLINDILDLSKIESGHMEIRSETVILKRLTKDLLSMFEPMARQKGLELTVQIAPDCPAAIETDRQRLEQILKNLFSNALKFTEKGKIELAIYCRDDQIAFAVSDTGIGIPPHQQQVIFEAFRQADGTISRKYGGTGLGLSISRQLTLWLGGRLDLQSEPGVGSTFIVILPKIYDPLHTVAPNHFMTPETNSAEQGHETFFERDVPQIRRSQAIHDDREELTGNGRVILVTEDDLTFAQILYDLVRELDFQCLIATTADESLALARQFLPRAIILDVGLPDNSGLSVLDRLKRDARTRHIPVHVISAHDHTETALALGAVGHMMKPVKRDELIATLKKMEKKFDQRLRRVLIVEDDDIQRDSMQKLLGSHDVKTVGVGTVAECLKQLKKSTFDCMVLDLSLPDASGYALLETLSREDGYSFPPVIVYTGRDLSADEEQRLRRYSKSIIIKGAKSPERLLDEVTLFLHQVVSELPLEQQRMLASVRNRDEILEGRHILVVEDDVANVYALTSILEPRGAIIHIARNGLEALKALKPTKDQANTIDLVLMDVMMPEMDGLTATREIRKQPEFKKLPIIMLTAKAMRDDQEKCLEAGANDYMAKPLDIEKLLSLVRVWMPR